MSGGPIIVQVFDSVLGQEVSLPLVDGNDAVTRFPARYSYVIPNPYGNDNPLPPTGLPPTTNVRPNRLSTRVVASWPGRAWPHKRHGDLRPPLLCQEPLAHRHQKRA